MLNKLKPEKRYSKTLVDWATKKKRNIKFLSHTQFEHEKTKQQIRFVFEHEKA